MRKEEIYKLSAWGIALFHFFLIFVFFFLFIYQFFNEKYVLSSLVVTVGGYFFVLLAPITKIKLLECPLTVWERNLRKKFDLNTKYKEFWAYYLKKIFKTKGESGLPYWSFLLEFFVAISILILRIIL